MYSLKLELKLNNQELSKLAGCAGFARFACNFGLSMLTASWSFEGIEAGDSKRSAAIEKVFIARIKINPDSNSMQKYPCAIYSQVLRNLAAAVRRWSKGNSGFSQFKSQKKGDSFTVLKKSGIYPAKRLSMLPFFNHQAMVPGKKIAMPGLGEFRNEQIPLLCHQLPGNRQQEIKASNNAKKYSSQIGVSHGRIADIRKNFLQKTLTFISRLYYRIRIEDLNISGMNASGKLAKVGSILRLYEFHKMLTYKEAFYRTLVELVDRWYPSSKICSSCSNIQPMLLSERVDRCQACGHVRVRDENASINLEKAPSDRVRRATTQLTPADKKESAPLAETGSKRQNKRVKELCAF